jgi:hypothetical protein
VPAANSPPLLPRKICGIHFSYIAQPTYEKVNEELFLDNPLHVILNNSKLAYRIYVTLIANKELIKKIKKNSLTGP